MTPYDQARAWLDKQAPAVNGAGGHNQTFHVACVLAHGFCLGRGEAWQLLCTYNAMCQPIWGQVELEHKLQAALDTHDGKPPGYMLKGQNHQRTAPTPRPSAAHRKPVVKPKPVTPSNLPEPLPDGARALIRALFNAGEGVRIANAALNDDGREVPANEGPCLSREEWLRKLDAAGGDPNRIWRNAKKTGIYITLNPLRVGGSKDADVTAYRHALVEFDSISREEQWAIYQSTNLPCAAVISSGGKSIHAWVKVDAKDRQEYDERVRILYESFADSGYALDTKNKNPSRFSRLPNCVRFNSRQELLALNVGSESFTAWLKERANADLKPCKKIPELDDMDPSHDPNCVLGFRDSETLRYLCKGKSAWLIGPSGIGKSSLLAQFALGWAQAKPVFGIAPNRPLKSLIIQAENDDMDLAEMVQGICAAHGFFAGNIPPEVVGNVLFYTETTSVGEAFVDKLHRLVDRERPDIVWCDPLLSFAGIEVSNQSQCSHFLRQMLQPVLESTGAVLIGLHHTGKPKFAKDIANWTPLDFAYSGIGSSELVNWARAVMVLHPHGNSQFELKLAKRGGRAGATNPDGSWAYSSIWIRHARKGVLWEQIEEPQAEEKPVREPKKPKHTPEPKLSTEEALLQILTSGPSPTPWEKFASESPDGGESARAFGARFQAASILLGKKIGLDAARKVWPTILKTKNLLNEDKSGQWHPTHKV